MTSPNVLRDSASTDVAPADLVRANTAPEWHRAMRLDYLEILVHCRSARPVREVATLARIPLDRATLLIDDLAARGLVQIRHEESASRHGRHRDLP
ncbi:MAG TPA: DUF742 domain-containing protein [Actinoplanes sp.]|nr:DUF742 domain-containing protein [Actinoplanes sp.]